MRILLLLLAVFHGLNGLAMIAAPQVWYAGVPGVVDTGPFNVHFVRDIGFGFIAAALSLALAAKPAADASVLWPGTAFLGGHALLHVAEMAVHGGSAADMSRDFALIVLPGLLPLAVAAAAWRKRRATT